MRSGIEDLLAGLRADLKEQQADALLVSSPANVRYLSDFSAPADGKVLVTADEALLITDARYTLQAEQETDLEVVTARPWQPDVVRRVGRGTLLVEADHLTLDLYAELSGALARTPKASSGLFRRYRAIKRPDEITRLREAARVTDAAFEHIQGSLAPGVREIEIALELERFMRTSGSEERGFDIIVASGPRGALPHGVASTRRLEEGDLVTLDFGARVGGYHADMTRTVALGTVDDRQRNLYGAVLEAQQLALEAVAPGVDGRELDRLARDSLAGHGLDDHFSHSLGHGVGLDIHEAPALTFRHSERLAPGMVVTIEPGVYLPGEGGVRIEDLVLVTETGHDLLSHSPKAFLQL